MNWPDFSNPQKYYVIVCFIENADLTSMRGQLEQLGNQRNVTMIVQPTVYEAIEFLYRVDADLLSHVSGYDHHVYCKALSLQANTAKSTIDAIAQCYYAYFTAVIEQNEAEVRQQAVALEGYRTYFAE